jgi:carbamoyl-phosphate synthase small subunit
MKAARLALEDGSIWHGEAFGAEGTQVGEVVFNTSLLGYQEILTDPSYAGQIVVMTAPQIGNTGVNLDDDESRRAFLQGFVVRDLSPNVSNWRSTDTLDAWLKSKDIIGIADIDTRALTRRLRDVGSLKGVLSTDESRSDDDLVAQAKTWEGLDGIDLVKTVTCDEPYHWTKTTDPEWEFKQYDPDRENGVGSRHVVVYDFGVKHNILRRLANYGCRLTIVPANTTAEQALALQPDGIFLSNGPGDPAAVSYAVEAVQELMGQVPIFGICLGHQILGQAFGGDTYRLKFGHHGGNQPVQYGPTQRVEISAHNHNFAVDADSLPDDVEVTHLNLNDGCCEGMRHKTLPILSVQYHPEAAPGPHDSDPLFDEFIALLKRP